MHRSDTKCLGNIHLIIKSKREDGNYEEEHIYTKNQVLKIGRKALAKCLTNTFDAPFDNYIYRFLVGNNGTVGGVPKVVDENRTSLFGTTILTKPVIASIDSSNSNLIILTSVISFTDIVGETFNEFALQLKNGDLYSMATFGDKSKTSGEQLTVVWELEFI